MIWSPEGAPVTSAPRHFAHQDTHQWRACDALPDPDEVLAKAGKGVEHLRTLLYDAHLSSVWGVRESGVVKYAHRVEGEDKKAVALCETHCAMWDVGRIAREVLGAVAYGIAPFELLWVARGSAWHIADVVGNPAEWFVWDAKRRAWSLRTALYKTKALPPLRFLIESHNASYTNVYGEKLFSRIFWNVTLKRNGLKWWSVWLEKFGSPYLVAKYGGESDKERVQLLDALDALRGSAIGVIGSDDELQTIDSAFKGSSAIAHEKFVKFHNGEISKAVLGQTLTTELDGGGSRAAAQVHDGVRVDIAQSDRRRVAHFFERIFALLVRVNLGDGVSVPRFVFDEPEDLQEKRIARDARLFALGGKSASDAYLEQFGLKGDMTRDEHSASVGMSAREEVALSQEGSEAQDDEKREGFISKLVSSFFSSRAKRYQKHVDTEIERVHEAVASSVSFEEALEVLMQEEQARATNVEALAKDVEEMRYVGRALGGAYAER